MAEVCVVHLVWAPLGLDPLARFVRSYRDRPAGLGHDLVVVFNGFRGEGELADYRRLLGGLAHQELVLPRPVQDIPAYFAAARAFRHRYFCFVNSHSVILDSGWLAKLHRHVTRDGVGLVGATGSYETRYPAAVPPFPWRWALGVLRRGWLPTAMAECRARQALRYDRRHFGPFPNPHIRTNGFMISRDVLLRVKCHPIRSKQEAWRFEAGKDGLTRQVLGMGLGPLVVGRDGQGYEISRWFDSHTFRSGEQRNVLISDNRTREYTEADPDSKRVLVEAAWGEQARRPQRAEVASLPEGNGHPDGLYRQ